MSYAFPDPGQQQPFEDGLPLPEAPAAGTMPPGDGGNVIPHFMTFGQIVNLASRTYRWTHDEALRDNWTNALAIRRDPVIMDALRSRQLPTAQLSWHLEAQNDQDERQADAVEKLTKLIERIPRFQQLKMHLLEALWYGRYGVQISYSWDFSLGGKYLTVRDFRPINGDKLVFRFSGAPGILVHQMYKGSWEATDRGRAHFFDQFERDQLVIHKHEPEDADFFEPELGGSVMGVGIRSRLYWIWFIRSQVTAFLMDYLERCGAGGFTIYYYEAGSTKSASEVTQAVENQQRNNAILFPRYRDGAKGGPGIERIEASTAGATLMQGLVTDYFDSVIRRYILGQNLTTEAASTGLGSGLADLHGETFARYIKYDAANLADTLTEQLVTVLQKNSPYRDAPPLRFVFDVDKPNAQETLEAAQAFFEMGGTIDEDHLRSIIGLEKPAPGGTMLAKMGAMSPASAGSLPEGIPMMGQPGPDLGQTGPAAGQEATAAQGSDLPGQGAPVMMRKKKGSNGKLSPKFHKPLRFAAPKRLAADRKILNQANSYLDRIGLPHHEEEADYLPIDAQRAARIADFAEGQRHNPDDPAVIKAYAALAAQTRAQYEHLQRQGVQFEPWTREGQPYANSAEMAQDARRGHMYFFTGGDFPKDHLLAQPSGLKHNGQSLSHNDLFRAVHDYFGHALYGNQFGPRGEEHAYRTHARMFTPEALPALAAETRGQNSWVNFGKHIRDNPNPPPPAERPFAEQKNFLMPQEHLGD